MRAEFADSVVHITLSRAEALSIGLAIFEGCETLSRAEYYLRSGLAQPAVREIALALIEPAATFDTPLEDGIPEVEAPPRPRLGRHQ
jgi:hypothetical protein